MDTITVMIITSNDRTMEMRNNRRSRYGEIQRDLLTLKF